MHTDATLYTFPPVSLNERNKYHQIAFGRPPPEGYYDSLTNVDKIPACPGSHGAAPDNMMVALSQASDEPLAVASTSTMPDPISQVSLRETLDKEYQDMLANFTPETEQETNLLIKIFRKIKNSRHDSKSSFMSLEYQWFKNEGRKTRKNNIKPLNPSRSKEKGVKGRPKRSHNLAKSVAANHANATKH